MGLAAGKLINERFQKTISIAMGLSVIALSNLGLVGNILIFCVGINIIIDGRGRIKVANLMPAIIFAVVAAYIPFLN